MAEYDDWIEQEELDQESAPQLRNPRPNAADPANRKSIVLHDGSNMPSTAKGKAKPPPVPAARASKAAPGGSSAAAAAQHELEEVNAAPDRRGSQSRLFPGMAIQSRTEKIKSGKKLEDYGFESKWPWAILALFFLAGGIVLAIFGGWCIKQDPNGDTAPPANELNACGPGGGLFDPFPPAIH